MRAGSFKRVLPLIVSVILVVTLLFTLTIPLSAASYNLRFYDFGLTYEFGYQTSSFIGSSIKTLPITSMSKSMSDVDGVNYSVFTFQQNTVTSIDQLVVLTADFTFDLDQSLILNANGATFYQVSFDVLFPDNYKPGESTPVRNVATLRNTDDDTQLAKLPLTFVRVDSAMGFNQWRATFMVNLTEAETYNEMYIDFYLNYEDISGYNPDFIEFYFSDLSIVESNAAAFQNYVSVSLDNVLAGLDLSNDLLKDIKNIVRGLTSDLNANFGSVLTLLSIIVTSGGNVEAKLDSIIELLETVSSDNSTLADKIEAGNQIQQQIADALKNSNQQDAAQNQTDKDRAENFQNSINDYNAAIESVQKPNKNDIEMDFGDLTGDNYNQGFVDSTLGVLYDNRYIGYLLFMVFGYSIEGFLLFGKRS